MGVDILDVLLLSEVLMIVILLRIKLPNGILLSVIILSEILLNVILPRVNMLGVILVSGSLLSTVLHYAVAILPTDLQ
jgi:hypothetical protein